MKTFASLFAVAVCATAFSWCPGRASANLPAPETAAVVAAPAGRDGTAPSQADLLRQGDARNARLIPIPEPGAEAALTIAGGLAVIGCLHRRGRDE